MTDKEPERLKATGDTPEELVRALRALGRDRDSERLARVAERLTATLAASGAPAGSWLQNVLGSKLASMGIVVGLGALGVLGYQLATRENAPVEQPAAPVPAVPSQVEARATPVQMPAQASNPVPARSSADPHRARPATQHEPRAQRAPKGAPSTATNEQARPAIETTKPAQEEAAPAQEAKVAEEEAAAPAVPEEPKPTAQAPAQPPPSEEVLLHRARKAASSEPAAALKLLDEHAARFPNGLLIPEREVLAIEVLRSLGRDAEAAQRLQRFQKRYPQSIHLRRLEQGRAAERDQ